MENQRSGIRDLAVINLGLGIRVWNSEFGFRKSARGKLNVLNFKSGCRNRKMNWWRVESESYEGCQWSILQLLAWLLSLWTGVRLRVTLLTYKHCCFLKLNYLVIVLTLYTLTSVIIFSILFSVHLPKCWQGEFVKQSTVSIVSWH